MWKQLNKWYLIPYLIFIGGGGILVFTITKGDEVVYLNSFHAPLYDSLFKNFTLLGEGVVLVTIIIALAFYSFRHSLLVIGAFLLSTLFTQILKNAINWPRPRLHLSNFDTLYQVPGVDIHSHLSFPSGHSTTVFALTFSLSCILYKERTAGLLLILLALATALSRIYLLQHFLMDVYAGSIIGVGSGLVVSYLLARVNKTWIDSSILKLINK